MIKTASTTEGSSSGLVSTVTSESGTKHDHGKPAVWRAMIEAFPNALTAISALSTFGASKYSWQNWKKVPDAKARYSDAMMRHVLDEQIEGVDQETGLPHAVSVAWNALARLEILLNEEKEANRKASEPVRPFSRDGWYDHP